MQWDIFCQVIDNHGDLGVCWRVAADLGQRGEQVRLWVDDLSALQWMAPQGAPGVQALAWRADTAWPAPGELLVEAFGCEPATDFIAAYAERARAGGHFYSWINLEYLTAEPFAERNHGLPSPVLSGPGAGLVKHFFYPGFTPRTGGLLREPDWPARYARFDRAAWLARLGIGEAGEALVSLFCYEPPALGELLAQLADTTPPTRLLVTAGRAEAAVRAAVALAAKGPQRLPRISYLPLMPQPAFDELLMACDFNFVRGEDSLVRAIWAGNPFAWQLYPQHDGAHHDKLEAFLGELQPPSDWARFQRVWNGSLPSPLPALDPPCWQAAATAFRARLLAQPDLTSALLGFITKKR